MRGGGWGAVLGLANWRGWSASWRIAFNIVDMDILQSSLFVVRVCL